MEIVDNTPIRVGIYGNCITLLSELVSMEIVDNTPIRVGIYGNCV
jgi:hypothetical protein